MKRTWGLIACIFLFVGCHTSKRPVLYKLGEQTDVDLTALQDKHASYESVYLFYKRDISHDLKPDVTNNAPRWYFLESYHWKEVVLDENVYGDVAAVRLKLGKDEKIRQFNARIHHPDESELLLKRKDLKRIRLAADSSSYELAVGALTAGTSIEIAYEIERKNLLKSPPTSHDVPLQLDKPVGNMEFSYTYPAYWEVQVKEVAPTRMVKLITAEDKKAETKTYSYTSTNVPAYKREIYGPYLKQVAPYFHVKVNHLEVGNELEWSGKTSWNRVAESYADLLKGSRKNKKQAQERLNKLGVWPSLNEYDRMELIQQHVESDIEIVPASGKRGIWKSKKGTPLEAAAYTSVLLKEAGIDTELLLAHTAEEGYFDESFITEEQFYAPVLKANVTGNDLYVFPDKKGVPLGYIPWEYANQVALHYKGSIYEGMVTVPSAPDVAYRDDGYYKLFVEEDGSVQVEVSMDLSLHTLYRLNQAQMKGVVNELGLVQDLLAHEASHIMGLSYRMYPTQDHENRLTASYELIDCFEVEDGHVAIQSCGLFDPVNTSWYPFQDTREAALIMPADIRVTNHVQVVYPENWAITTPMQNIVKRGKQVHFERTFAQRSGQLDVNQHVIFQRDSPQTITNPTLTHSYRLPLGTSLEAIKLGVTPQVVVANLPIIQGGPWTVVVETYDTYDDAVDKVLELESSSSIDALPVRILNDGPVNDKYHVLMGNFSSRKEVETTRILLSAELPYDSWIALVNPQMTAVLNADKPVTY